MKKRITNFILNSICLIFLVSCNKKEVLFDPEMIAGTWHLENVTLNEIIGTDISPSLGNSAILTLDQDNSYYRNYVIGNWSVDNRNLILDSDDYMDIPNWEYVILQATAEKLELLIFLTEGQYYGDFDEFEADELLTIKETYIR